MQNTRKTSEGLKHGTKNESPFFREINCEKGFVEIDEASMSGCNIKIDIFVLGNEF